MEKKYITHLLFNIGSWILVALNALFILLGTVGTSFRNDDWGIEYADRWIEIPFLGSRQVSVSLLLFIGILLIVWGITGLVGSLGMLTRRRWGLYITRGTLILYTICEFIVLAYFMKEAFIGYYYGPSYPNYIMPILIYSIMMAITLGFIYLLYTSTINNLFSESGEHNIKQVL
jgi:hypothetical protein